MSPDQIVGLGMLLSGAKILYDATAGNRRQRVALARMFRSQQSREQKRKSVIMRNIRRMLWWPTLSVRGRMFMAVSGAATCLVGSLVIVL